MCTATHFSPTEIFGEYMKGFLIKSPGVEEASWQYKRHDEHERLLHKLSQGTEVGQIVMVAIGCFCFVCLRSLLYALVLFFL